MTTDVIFVEQAETRFQGRALVCEEIKVSNCPLRDATDAEKQKVKETSTAKLEDVRACETVSQCDLPQDNEGGADSPFSKL